MAFQLRDNAGALFKNDRKATDKHPDYKGNAIIGGVEYWMDAWIKKSEKGTFLSISLKPKEPRNAPPPRGPDDDDIPF